MNYKNNKDYYYSSIIDDEPVRQGQVQRDLKSLKETGMYVLSSPA